MAVKLGETTSVLYVVYLIHECFAWSLALKLFRYVNPILNYINTFELLPPSLKISPWTTPTYFPCVTPLSLKVLDAWHTDAGRHSVHVRKDQYAVSAYSGMCTHLRPMS